MTRVKTPTESSKNLRKRFKAVIFLVLVIIITVNNEIEKVKGSSIIALLKTASLEYPNDTANASLFCFCLFVYFVLICFVLLLLLSILRKKSVKCQCTDCMVDLHFKYRALAFEKWKFCPTPFFCVLKMFRVLWQIQCTFTKRLFNIYSQSYSSRRPGFANIGCSKSIVPPHNGLLN